MNRGFNSAVSGLSAAQTGLYVTGHNMANTSTVGYTRQNHLQSAFNYQSVGSGLQVGLGTDVSMIRQIRNEYLDTTYRNEVGRTNFYSVKYQTGNEIENIYGELQSQYSTQSITQDMWDAINELTMHPAGIETRANFIATATSYITKMNNIQERLIKEQHNLNESIKDTVTRINQLTTKINELNNVIPSMEASGQRANDYRDQRNLCLDELSKLIKIEYKENVKGEVVVTTNGSELVANGNAMHIGLRYTAGNCAFVEPVFTPKGGILAYDPTFESARSVFNFNGSVGSEYGNDYGELFGLIIARGLYPTDYTTMTTAEFINAANDPASATNQFVTSSTVLGFPTAPTNWPDASDSVLYPNGTEDPAYLAAYKTYKNDLQKHINDIKNYYETEPTKSDIIAEIGQDAYDKELSKFNTYYAKAKAVISDFDSYESVINANNFYMNAGAIAVYTLPVGTPVISPMPAAITVAWPDPSTYKNGEKNPDYIKAYDAYAADVKRYLSEMKAYFDDPAVAGWAGLATEKAAFEQNASEANAVLDNYKYFRNNYKPYEKFNTTQCVIPKTMREMDILFNHVIKMINSTLSDGYDLTESDKEDAYTPVFTLKLANGKYSMGNVEVNPDLLDPDGYKLLQLGTTDDIDNGKLAEKLLEEWKKGNLKIDNSYAMNIEEAYRYIINNLATETNKSLTFYESQEVLVNEIDTKRMEISGVSLDEEMKNMMIYQHAFNAASRMINVIDSMIDKIINGTGRVGL